jgi:molybdopterin-containing oxidoreductase family membrane subunit
MSTGDISSEDIIRPINLGTTRIYYAIFGAAGLVAALWAVAWALQLQHGLIVTNLSDWGSGGGATWGLYVGAFIWWVGIAHGGIILSAAVRLFGMDRYKPVARMAELMTIGALSVAGLYIVVHVGRPDRIVTSVLAAYIDTVMWSPLVWDVTVITLYFVMTATYLGLTLRYDIARLRDAMPDYQTIIPSTSRTPAVKFPMGMIYDMLTLGYSPEEDETIERMVWWLALAVIVLAPLLLHGGVIPWLFSLIGSKSAWYGAVQGPSFLMIALTSAISGIIIAGAIFRRAYDWYHILTDDVFRGLTLWLGFFSMLFLWLQLQQIITGVYAPPTAVAHVWEVKLSDARYFAVLGLVGGTLAYIFATAVEPSVFSVTRSIIGSVAVLIGTLTEKVLFVVEGTLDADWTLYAAVPGEYTPSLIEISSLFGTIAIVVLFFMIVVKVVPIVELHAVEELREKEGLDPHDDLAKLDATEDDS